MPDEGQALRGRVREPVHAGKNHGTEVAINPYSLSESRRHPPLHHLAPENSFPLPYRNPRLGFSCGTYLGVARPGGKYRRDVHRIHSAAEEMVGVVE